MFNLKVERVHLCLGKGERVPREIELLRMHMLTNFLVILSKLTHSDMAKTQEQIYLTQNRLLFRECLKLIHYIKEETN